MIKIRNEQGKASTIPIKFELIKSRFEEGLTIDQICFELGINRKTLYRRRKQWGYEFELNSKRGNPNIPSGENHPCWKGGKETFKERSKKYYNNFKKSKPDFIKINAQKYKKYRNEWRKNNRHNNPELVKVMNNNRRTATKDLTVNIIQRVYEDNIKKYGTLTCYLCEESVQFRKDHLEHKTPLSRGGTNLYENLAIACQSCNCRKNNKTETEYREALCLR